MSEHINFLAAAGNYVYLSIAEDPAATVAEMRPHCPLPIELVAGWIVPSQARAKLQRQVSRKLSSRRVAPQWYDYQADQAAEVLEQLAKRAGGTAWTLRKRPLIKPKPPSMARAVITPHGRFESAAEAARKLGVTRAAVSLRALTRSPGWRYADDLTPQPPPVPRGRPPIEYEEEEDGE